MNEAGYFQLDCVFSDVQMESVFG